MPIITAFVTCQFIKVQNTFKALGSAQDKKKILAAFYIPGTSLRLQTEVCS